MKDLYGPLLARALFPAFEAARGRPTVPLLRYLQATERWSLDQLHDPLGRGGLCLECGNGRGIRLCDSCSHVVYCLP